MSLKGKKIVLSGVSIKRTEAAKLTKSAGAVLQSTLNQDTDILVSGDDSKNKKAKEYGCDIWSEEQFVKAASSSKRAAAESDSEDDEPAAKRPKGKGAKAKGAKAKGAKAKAAKAKGAKAQEKEESESESSSQEEEEEKPAKKAPAKAKGAKAKGAKAKAQKKEESESESSSSEEKKPAAKPKEAASPKPAGERRGPKPDRTIAGADTYTVYEDWHVKLNQTNIGGNNNKYYFIQLLEKNGSYTVFTRWGRVGEDGMHKLDSMGTNLDRAMAGFRKKFKDKTKNDWDNRANFVKYPGKYMLVETEETDDDDNAAPIGKLTVAQIEKGFKVLERLEKAINDKRPKNVINELSSEFFTLVPTNFGRKVPKPIETIQELKEKDELLKFWMRMGFQEMEDDEPGLTPISGVMALPVPATLQAAASNVCGIHDIQSSQSNGARLSERQAGKPRRQMNEHLYGSIMLYTSNAIYSALNKALREENRAQVKKYFNYLRLLFEAMDALPPQKRTLWRGISVDLSQQYKVGETITWWGVSSCTSDRKVAENFMHGLGGKCSFLTVDCQTACDISELSFFANEKESLLAPGTQLKVKSCKIEGNIAHIHLEEVGRAIH